MKRARKSLANALNRYEKHEEEKTVSFLGFNDSEKNLELSQSAVEQD